MPRLESALRQHALVLADGGMETALIFHDGFDLPLFASFPLVRTEAGVRALEDYYESFVAVAAEHDAPVVLDAPTWRASAHWGAQLGYDPAALVEVNRDAVRLVEGVRRRHSGTVDILVSGAVGPHGDAYRPDELLTAEEARAYHLTQIESLAESGVDVVTALTLTYPDEAVGIVGAAREVGVPVVVSFTVERDGRLPSGDTLEDAVRRVDDATDGAAAYFMVNCAHPTHLADALADGEPWIARLGGLRCNASAKSHAELDESEELDEGDIGELASLHAALRPRLPGIRVVGGCCGTDHRHVAAVAAAWLSAA